MINEVRSVLSQNAHNHPNALINRIDLLQQGFFSHSSSRGFVFVFVFFLFFFRFEMSDDSFCIFTRFAHVFLLRKMFDSNKIVLMCIGNRRNGSLCG